jgi:hypothetical protein
MQYVSSIDLHVCIPLLSKATRPAGGRNPIEFAPKVSKTSIMSIRMLAQDQTPDKQQLPKTSLSIPVICYMISREFDDRFVLPSTVKHQHTVPQFHFKLLHHWNPSCKAAPRAPLSSEAVPRTFDSICLLCSLINGKNLYM